MSSTSSVKLLTSFCIAAAIAFGAASPSLRAMEINPPQTSTPCDVKGKQPPGSNVGGQTSGGATPGDGEGAGPSTGSGGGGTATGKAVDAGSKSIKVADVPELLQLDPKARSAVLQKLESINEKKFDSIKTRELKPIEDDRAKISNYCHSLEKLLAAKDKDSNAQNLGAGTGIQSGGPGSGAQPGNSGAGKQSGDTGAGIQNVGTGVGQNPGADGGAQSGNSGAAVQGNGAGQNGLHPWLFPALALIVSLFAIGYVIYIQKRSNDLLDSTKRSMGSLKGDLEEAEFALETRKKAELAAAAQSAASKAAAAGRSSNPSAKPSNRAKAEAVASTFHSGDALGAGLRRPFSEEASVGSFTTPGVLRATQPTEVPTDPARAAAPTTVHPSERESKGITPVTPARPAQVPVLLPDPRKATGDIVADYNKARTMGDDGGDWFKDNYDWIGLSCTNLNERHLDPNVVLLFQEENRGSFLGVRHKGEMRLVPALDKELEVSSSFLAGVFDYPSQRNGPLMLFRAATIEQNGSGFQLKQSGEIKLER